MTVNYLQTEQKSQQKEAPHSDVTCIKNEPDGRVMFEDGFVECTRNVVRFLNGLSGGTIGSDTRARLLRYLRQKWLRLTEPSTEDSTLPEEHMEHVSNVLNVDTEAMDLSLTSRVLSSDVNNEDDDWTISTAMMSPISSDDSSSPPASPRSCCVTSTTPDDVRPVTKNFHPAFYREQQRTFQNDHIDKIAPVTEDPLWRPW